jgi:serine/threonine-protein kinase
VTDDQTLYFVMELLDGLDLDSLVRQHGRLPAGRVVHVLTQACASLEEAHVRGLVHRDIKPANIHVGTLGLVCDFVKVLDFGLVKPIADRSVEQSLTTQAGLVVGTPGYMAPEMVVSDSVDGRADIYALGCVGYYLLTGQQVFDGDTAMKVIAKHLQEVPIPPSQRVPNDVPRGLEQVILACLAKKPEDRPPGAAALADLLSAAGVEPWTSEQAAEWWATARLNAGARESDDRTVTSVSGKSQPETTSNSVTAG